MFGRVSLRNSSVLDIGAGRGDTSLYAASAGAARVVSLEPEAAGSHTDMQAAFEVSRDRLGLHQVVLRGETFQDFDPGDDRFDVIVSKASINHLDEERCVRLHSDPGARQEYRQILGKLAEIANPGAHLIVWDCARRNLFAQLGVRNPFFPAIEWHKHQQPALWAELLEGVGFRTPEIRWETFNTLRAPGQTLFGNRVLAYMTTSVFCLTMRRA